MSTDSESFFVAYMVAMFGKIHFVRLNNVLWLLILERKKLLGVINVSYNSYRRPSVFAGGNFPEKV